MKVHIKNTSLILTGQLHKHHILVLKAIINDGWLEDVCDCTKEDVLYLSTYLNNSKVGRISKVVCNSSGWVYSYILVDNQKLYFRRK